MKLLIRLQSTTNLINFKNLKHVKYLSSKNFIQRKEEENWKQSDKKNILVTIPNCLTLARIASIPFINYFVFIDQHEYACGLFLAAGLTDFLDGYIARNFKNQQSYLGSIIDPLADKLLIGSLTISLTLNSMLPVQLAILILSRDLALIFYSLYIRYKLINKPVTLKKFINIKESRIQVEADLISKINTFLQIALITLTLPSNLLLYNNSIYLTLFQYLTGLTTIASSLSYLYKRGSYKIIDKPNKF